jgi:hypothetical protein
VEGLSRREAFRFQKPIAIVSKQRIYYAWVDAEDALWAARISWKPHRWFPGADPVARGVIDGARRYLHHEVLVRAKGPKPSDEHVCDFKNGDRLDCRRSNLRWSLKTETLYQLKKRAAANAVKIS